MQGFPPETNFVNIYYCIKMVHIWFCSCAVGQEYQRYSIQVIN